MWPYATNKSADRALTAAFVVALALVHLGAIMLIEPRARVEPAAPTRISMETGPVRGRPAETSATPRLAGPKATTTGETVAPEPPRVPESAPESAPAAAAVPAADEDRPGGRLDDAPADDAVGGAADDGYPDRRRTDLTAMVMRRLEERKVYPMAARRRGVEGDVVVRFTLGPDGSLAAIAAEPEGAHPLLRRAAVDSVIAAAPFPLPAGLGEGMEFAVTIAYRLSD